MKKDITLEISTAKWTCLYQSFFLITVLAKTTQAFSILLLTQSKEIDTEGEKVAQQNQLIEKWWYTVSAEFFKMWIWLT